MHRNNQQSNLGLIQTLPFDTLVIIFSLLSIKSLTTFMLSNKAFLEIISNWDSFWEKTFHTHFSNDFSKPENMNWHGLFLKRYPFMCKPYGLSSVFTLVNDSRDRDKLFFLVCDNDLSTLKTKQIIIEDLFKTNPINNETLLDSAFRLKHQDVLDYFYGIAMKRPSIDYYRGHTTLHFAVLCNQISRIEGLITKPENCQVAMLYNGHTALQLALSRVEILKIMLTTHRTLINKLGMDGNSLLFQAIKNKMHDAVKLILEIGSHLNNVAGPNFDKRQGWLPIHCAASKGNLEDVKLLLKYDPKLLNTQDVFGRTPVMYAACSKNSDLVRFLCEQGAELNKFYSTTTYNGMNIFGDLYRNTAMHFAAQRNHWEAVKILIEYGASPLSDALPESFSRRYPSDATSEPHIKALIELERFIIEFSLTKDYNPSFFSWNQKVNFDENTSLLEAAQTLKYVCLGHTKISSLDKYKKELESDALCGFYKALVAHFPKASVEAAPSFKF